MAWRQGESMEAIQRVDLGQRTDQRQAIDALEFAWPAFARTSETQRPPEPAVEADLGRGLADSAAEREVRRSTAYAEFEVQRKTGEVLIKIIDEESGEVIRTVPPEELARALRSAGPSACQWRIYV